MAEDTTLSIAKEITLNAMPKVSLGGDLDPKSIGQKYGELFKVIIKQVIQGINEARK